jgi:branched-subunit amino acid aminotransferase/4-amino-4-deoxychorismate lyase
MLRRRLETVIYIGGRFVTAEEAKVDLLDRGYLLGDGVFATMRGYGGVCFRPDAHLRELARGAEMLGIELSAPLAEIAEVADEAARRTGEEHAYVRVTLTHGPIGRAPTLSVLARAMSVPPAAAYDRGIHAVTVTPRRVPPACIDGTIKTTSYAVQILAGREVARHGADEGIQLAVDGSLACGTMANLFVVLDNRLLTPALETGCRAGVTRAAVLELAPRLGLEPREERLAPSVLAEADEVFFTSTRVECLPVATVDGRPVGRGSFDRTHALRAALSALVREETAPRRAKAGRA